MKQKLTSDYELSKKIAEEERGAAKNTFVLLPEAQEQQYHRPEPGYAVKEEVKTVLSKFLLNQVSPAKKSENEIFEKEKKLDQVHVRPDYTVILSSSSPLMDFSWIQHYPETWFGIDRLKGKKFKRTSSKE